MIETTLRLIKKGFYRQLHVTYSIIEWLKCQTCDRTSRVRIRRAFGVSYLIGFFYILVFIPKLQPFYI